MKQKLRFQSELEFQSFFGQLSSAEIPDFLPVEGSGGDRGFDGLSGTTAYQAYFPDEKNRTDAKYIDKINKDLGKIIKNKRRLGLEITDWIFVVPEDLRINVIAHLRKKSKEIGIKCTYWGATKLSELITKYPHIQDSFPIIFLPPVRKKISEIEAKLSLKPEDKISNSVDVLTDFEYSKQFREVKADYKSEIKDYPRNRHGHIASEYAEREAEHRLDADLKISDLNDKRKARDKAYELDLEELTEMYDELLESTNNEMAERGLFSSGIKDRAIGRIEKKRQRDIERLKLKYGKMDPALSVVEG